MTTGSVPHRLAILGAGVMGSGIAALALGHGVPVVLLDVDRDALDRARARVAQQLRHATLLSALPADCTPGELVVGGSPRDATVVVEAVTERREVKTAALTQAARLAPPGTPLISNTSGIPIDELAAELPRPQDLVGTHFMNPPYLITMVEVVRGPRTGEHAMAGALRLLAALHRRAVVVGDTPGFVTSRLLHPMINDAVRLLAAGTATAEGIDSLMQGCLGHRTGPLRTADLIGLDNLADALLALFERTGDERCRPAELLLDKVRAGDLGRKTGRGFYDYGGVLP